MKLLLIAAMLASCSRKLPVTPAYMVIHATAATCESVQISDIRSKVWAECRYTLEDGWQRNPRAAD